jgi:hypothetical protein
MADFFGLYVGTVFSVEDPEQAGRIQVTIPGICEPNSGWARPRGLFGSAKNLGLYGVPPEGSEVLVQFEAGDIDSPWYEPSGVAAGEMPPRIKGTLNKYGFGFGDLQFEVEIKDSGKSVLTIYSLAVPDSNQIILDAETNQITIQSLTGLNLSCVGQIDITAGLVTIQGRPVTPGVNEI